MEDCSTDERLLLHISYRVANDRIFKIDQYLVKIRNVDKSNLQTFSGSRFNDIYYPQTNIVNEMKHRMTYLYSNTFKSQL